MTPATGSPQLYDRLSRAYGGIKKDIGVIVGQETMFSLECNNHRRTRKLNTETDQDHS